jgi:DNA polymerase III alpha subunit (gram-positive type)
MSIEIYVSTDIETGGPIPGPNSMLSFGSAAFTLAGQVGHFSANLHELPDSVIDPVTKREFWDKNPEAWAECRKDLQNPKEVMENYVGWLNNLPGKPVFVGYPASFDFMFVYWYLIKFTGQSPFSFSALDIKSYTMAVLKTEFRETTKKRMPKRWFPKSKHSHVAIEDAIEQGELFMNILKENERW